MSDTKPTAAAMRAAYFVWKEEVSDVGLCPRLEKQRRIAEIIDRETGLPELIAACRLASCVEQANLDDLRAQGEPEDGANICACKQSISIYKAAIAKAEGR